MGVRVVKKRSALVGKPLREAEQNMFDSFNISFNISLYIFQCQGTRVSGVLFLCDCPGFMLNFIPPLAGLLRKNL